MKIFSFQAFELVDGAWKATRTIMVVSSNEASAASIAAQKLKARILKG